MTIERFLNHIYYSFAAIDRRFENIFYDGLSHLREGDDLDSIASKLMAFSLGGYLIGLMYVFILLPIRLLGYTPAKTIIAVLVVAFLFLALSFILGKYFAPPVYRRYYKEFSGNKDYDSFTWNILSILFFVGGGAIFLFVVFHI